MSTFSIADEKWGRKKEGVLSVSRLPTLFVRPLRKGEGGGGERKRKGGMVSWFLLARFLRGEKEKRSVLPPFFVSFCVAGGGGEGKGPGRKEGCVLFLRWERKKPWK